jgi:hypothetical protein
MQPLDALLVEPKPDASGRHLDPVDGCAEPAECGCSAKQGVTGELSFALMVMGPDGQHVGRHEGGHGLCRRRRDGLPVFRARYPSADHDAHGAAMFIVAVGEGASD